MDVSGRDELCLLQKSGWHEAEDLLYAAFILSFPCLWERSLCNRYCINRGDSLLLDFKVKNTLQEDLRNAINNGMSVTYVYFVNLYEVRELWWDKKIAQFRLLHNIEYDILKEVYLVRLSKEENKTISLTDFKKMVR